MTITAERYIVRPSAEHEDVYDVEPSDFGLSRGDVDRDLCVAWGDPVTGAGGVLKYEALDWDYVNAPGGFDYVVP